MHRTKFDEHVTKQFRNEACGLPKDAGAAISKVVTGERNQTLKPSTLDMLNSAWQSVVEPATGYDSYASFRLGVNKELGRAFGLSQKT